MQSSTIYEPCDKINSIKTFSLIAILHIFSLRNADSFQLEMKVQNNLVPGKLTAHVRIKYTAFSTRDVLSVYYNSIRLKIKSIEHY